MLEDGPEGAVEAVEVDLGDPEEIEGCCLACCGFNGDPGVPGGGVGEGPADGFEVGPHGGVVGFVVELGGADIEFGGKHPATVAGHTEPDAAGAVASVEAAPQRAAFPEEAEVAGVLVVDVEPEVTGPAQAPEEKVALGLFQETVILGEGTVSEGGEEEANGAVGGDEAGGGVFEGGQGHVERSGRSVNTCRNPAKQVVQREQIERGPPASKWI